MNSAPRRANRVKAELTLLGISFAWGSTFILVKSALDDASTLVFLALRFSLAAVLLSLIFARRLRHIRFTSLIWKGGAVAGTLLFLGYALQTMGLRDTTASRSAFITGLYVVLVPLLGSCVNKSAPRAAEMLGVTLALAGTALMTSGNLAGFGVGEALTAGCAVAFAAHMLAVEHYSRQMSYEVLSILQVAGVGLLAGSTLWWAETPKLVFTSQVLTAIIVTAVFATALSFAAYTWAQRQTTATRAALIFASEPVFAGLTAWVVAGEAWTWRSLAGAALILGGITAVELKPSPGIQHPSG